MKDIQDACVRKECIKYNEGACKAFTCKWDCMGDVRAWIAPVRMSFSPGILNSRACHYVRAGARQLRLAASTWARFLVRGPGITRRQSMELYEAEFGKPSGSPADLGSLEGLRLVCHGAPSQLCHAGVLIRLFIQHRAALLAPLAAPPASEEEALAQAAARRAALTVPRMGEGHLGLAGPDDKGWPG